MLHDVMRGDAPPTPDGGSSTPELSPDGSAAGEIRAFLSYARRDLAEVDLLAALLRAGGVQVYMDRLNIEPGDDWKQRLADLILGCEVFVFAISPASVASRICDWEINEAERLSKRIFPVRLLDTADADIPRRLLRLHIVEMRVSSERADNAAKLLGSIRVDARWTREHTRLLERAESWKRSGRTSGRLSGRELAEAESWLARRPASAQAPSPLHVEYIRGSRGAVVRRHAWVGSIAVLAVLAVAAIAVLRKDAALREASSALIDTAARATALVNSPRQREGLVTAVSAGRKSEQLFGRIIPGVLAPLLDALARSREVLRVDDPGRQTRDMRVSDRGEILLLYRRDEDDIGVSDVIGATWTLGGTPRRTDIKAARSSDKIALCPRGSCYLVGQGERMIVLDVSGAALWSDLDKAMAADLDPDAGILYRVTADGSLVRRGRSKTDRDDALRAGFQDATSVQLSRDGQAVLVLDGQGAHLLDVRTSRWSDFDLPSCQSPATLSADGSAVLCAAPQGTVARFTVGSREPETIASHGLATAEGLVAGPLKGQYAIASSYGGSIAVFRDSELTAGPFYGGESSRIAFLPDGAHVVEIGWLDRQLKLFELGAQPLRVETHQFEADLARIAPCGPDRWAVAAFDGRVGLFGRSVDPVLWPAHDGMVNRITCLGDGRILSAGDDGRLLLTRDGRTTTLASGSEQKFRNFDLLPGGQELLAADGKDVWRLGVDGTRAFLFRTGLDDVWCLAVDGRTELVFLGSSGAGTVEVRRLDGTLVTAPYRAHVGLVNGLAPLWTAHEVITAGTLGTTDMMSLSKRQTNGQLETTANAHKAMTTSLAVDEDFRLIVSAGDDGQVQFWDETLAKVGPPILRSGAFIASVALSERRELAAVSGKDAYTVRYAPDDLFAQACARLLGRAPDACSRRKPDAACGACPPEPRAAKAAEAETEP